MLRHHGADERLFAFAAQEYAPDPRKAKAAAPAATATDLLARHPNPIRRSVAHGEGDCSCARAALGAAGRVPRSARA